MQIPTTGLTATGLGTGLDIKGIVDKLVAAERQPAANRLNIQEVRANSELSALGKFKSALTTFQDALGNLTKLENFQQRAVSVGNDTVFTATAGSTTIPGSYDIEVKSLASGHKLASGAFADINTPVGTGNLTITVNGQSNVIAIADPANTLADIRNAINNAPDNPGVLATIVNAQDGAHLAVSSRDTGLSQAIAIAASGGDGGLSVFNFDAATGTGAMSELQAAADASIVIDGFAISSSTNVFVNPVEGVTINVLQADPGVTNKLQITLDKSAATQSVQTFVDSYNSLIGTISTVTAFNAETGVAGPLLGDVQTRGVKSALRRELSQVVKDTGADFSSLVEIGITTTASGTLELDQTKLSAAMSSNFDAVGQLFAKKDVGIAVRMDGILATILDSGGQIDTREGTLKNRLDRIKNQRDQLDSRIERVRARLMRQFNAMDALVGKLNTTSSFLTQQLQRLPGARGA